MSECYQATGRDAERCHHRTNPSHSLNEPTSTTQKNRATRTYAENRHGPHQVPKDSAHACRGGVGVGFLGEHLSGLIQPALQHQDGHLGRYPRTQAFTEARKPLPSAHTGFLALEKRDGSLPPEVIQFIQSPSFNLYHAFQTARCNPLQVMTNF